MSPCTRSQTRAKSLLRRKLPHRPRLPRRPPRRRRPLSPPPPRRRSPRPTPPPAADSGSSDPAPAGDGGSAEPAPADTGDKADSGKSDEGSQPADSGKSDEGQQPADSGKNSDKNDTSDQSDKSDKSDKDDKSDKHDETDKTDETDQSDEGEDKDDETPYPAQTLTDSNGSVVVKVDVPADTLPEGSSVSVTQVDRKDGKDLAKAADLSVASHQDASVTAATLTFYDAEGNQVTPQGAVHVTVTVPGSKASFALDEQSGGKIEVLDYTTPNGTAEGNVNLTGATLSIALVTVTEKPAPKQEAAKTEADQTDAAAETDQAGEADETGETDETDETPTAESLILRLELAEGTVAKDLHAVLHLGGEDIPVTFTLAPDADNNGETLVAIADVAEANLAQELRDLLAKGEKAIFSIHAAPAEETGEETEETPAPAEETEEAQETQETPAEAVPAPVEKSRYTWSDGSLTVVAIAPGAFPAGTEMYVTRVNPQPLIDAAVESGMDKTVGAVAVDITFWNDGREVQPEGSVKVLLQTAKPVEGNTFQAVTMDGAGNLETLGGASQNAAVINTDHFTVYGIVGEEYEDDIVGRARYTYEFYAGTPGTDPSGWAKVDTQIVIFGEDVREPKLPAAGDGYYFSRWKTEEGETLPFTNGVIQSPVPEDASGDKLIRVYATYDRVFYVYFHTKEKGNEDDAIYRTMEGRSGAQINVDDVELTSVEAPNAFVGWVNEGGDTVTGSVPIVAEDIHLYPDIRPGATVTFNANEGQFGLGEDAEETYDVIVPRGFTVDEPQGASLPTRTGYKIDGWFTDEECTESYNFKTSVEEDFTLYAKWEPGETSYILRVYRENEDNEDYTIYSPEIRGGVKTGEPVPVSRIIEEFRRKNNLGDYKYFHLNGTGASGTEFADNLPAIQIYDGEETPGKLLAAYDSEGNLKEGDADNAVIAGDGSTIVRVNFSRDSFRLKFVFRWSDWLEGVGNLKYVTSKEGTFYGDGGEYYYGTELKPNTPQATSVSEKGGAMDLKGTDRIVKYGQSLYEAAYRDNPTIQGFLANRDWWLNGIFRMGEGQTRFDETNLDYRLREPKNGSEAASDGDTLYCVIRWTKEQKVYPIRDIYYLSNEVNPENINKDLTPAEPTKIYYNNNHQHSFTIGMVAGGYRLAAVTGYAAGSTIDESGETKSTYKFEWDDSKKEYKELVCHWVPNKYKITFLQEAQADLEIRGEDIADGSVMECPYGTENLNSLIDAKLKALRADQDNGKKWIAVTDTHGVAWACDRYSVTYADDGTEVENLDDAKLERDLKVTLLWKPESYVVYYDPDNTDNGFGDVTKAEVKAYSRAKSWKNLKEGNEEFPEKPGFIFTGWTAYEPEGDGDNVTAGAELQRSFDFGTAITRNYYLKASWEPVTGYSVRYDAVMNEDTDGTPVPKVTGSFTNGQYYDDPVTYRDSVSVPVTAVQPEAKGYRFLGWRLPGGDIVRGGSFTLKAGDCDSDGRYVLTAVYGEEKEGTTVTYHARYPGVNADHKVEIPHEVINGDFTVAEPDAADIMFRRVYVSNGSAYQFKTWTNDENAPVVGMADEFDYFNPTEKAAAGRDNNHLYAVWEVIVNNITPPDPDPDPDPDPGRPTPPKPPEPPTPPEPPVPEEPEVPEVPEEEDFYVEPIPEPDPEPVSEIIDFNEEPDPESEKPETPAVQEPQFPRVNVPVSNTPVPTADTPTRVNNTSVPRTGDDSHTALWATLCAVSAAGLAAVALGGRKRKNEA